MECITINSLLVGSAKAQKQADHKKKVREIVDNNRTKEWMHAENNNFSVEGRKSHAPNASYPLREGEYPAAPILAVSAPHGYIDGLYSTTF